MHRITYLREKAEERMFFVREGLGLDWRLSVCLKGLISVWAIKELEGRHYVLVWGVGYEPLESEETTGTKIVS